MRKSTKMHELSESPSSVRNDLPHPLVHGVSVLPVYSAPQPGSLYLRRQRPSLLRVHRHSPTFQS